jgi:hypothetical protein
VDRGLITHEHVHGLVGYLGIRDYLDDAIRNNSLSRRLYNAFTPESKAMYKDTWPEEVYAYLSQAVRNTDENLIKAFADADDGRENVLKYTADISRGLLSEVGRQPDSLHKRMFERQLNLVLRRTGTLSDTSRSAEVMGESVSLRDGQWVVTDGATELRFSTREEAAKAVEERFQEPLTAANLVDEDALPEGIERFATTHPVSSKRSKRASDPLSLEIARPPAGRVKGGFQATSYWFTPFYSWVDTVAKKNNWPELYRAFGVKLKQAQLQFDVSYNDWSRRIVDTKLTELPKARREDLAHYLETPAEAKPKVATELNLTNEELAIANKVRGLYDEAFTELGINPELYLEDYVSRIRKVEGMDPDLVKPSGRLAPEHTKFFGEMVRSGELDPREEDLASILSTYFRLGLRKKVMGDAFEEAGKMVNLKTPEGEFVLGSLQPYFKRHLELLRGRPDASQKVVEGVFGAVTDTFNAGLAKVNKTLPASLQIPEIKLPEDAMRRWMLFSYAGSMGLRPMVPIRDSTQLLLTTYPLLGEKYLGVGLQKAFGVFKGYAQSDAWQIAEQYGALMHENPLHNLITSGYQSAADSGTLTKLADWMLKPLLISNNSNRLISFWGHSEKALNAIQQFALHGDLKRFTKDSGAWVLDSNLKDSFIKELQATTPDKWRDLSFRLGKELTDVSQWNYHRGASPGLYKYALGRLFGQYGTWPLNYVNYTKRLLTQGDAADRVATGARLASMHAAVLSTLESFGVDGGQWVFTQPMAYGGGPSFQTFSNLLQSIDVETFRGEEARRDLLRQPTTMIPGGLAARQLYNAVMNDDPDMWKIVMGFTPMTAKEEEQGMHALVP